MRWQGMLGLGALWLLAAASGCGPNRGLLNADQAVLDAISQTGMDEPSPLSRAQKPDGNRALVGDVRPASARSEHAEIAGLAPTARIAVTVNGQAILEQEIRAACSHLLRAAEHLPDAERSARQAEIYNAARDQLIDRELVIQDMEHKLGRNKQAEKALEKIREAAHKEFDRWQRHVMEANHIASVEDFKEFLRQAMGSSYEMARRQVARSFMSSEFAKHEVFQAVSDAASHAAIQAYYDSHPEDFRVAEAVEWQDLFIHADKHPSREAARRFAEVLAARARSGEDFAKLANEFDNGVAGARENASGIGSKRGEISPSEVEGPLFRLQEGQVAVVELHTGYHVVKLVKHTQAGQMPFDEKVQRRIKDKIQNEVFQRELKHYITELKRKAVIEKFDSQ